MVERVLEDVPATRNSDITLTIEIWKRYYPDKIITGKSGRQAVLFEHLYTLPREDNVKRYRAKLQNDQLKFLPTDPAVAKQRGINEEVWRRNMSEPEAHSRLRTIQA